MINCFIHVFPVCLNDKDVDSIEAGYTTRKCVKEKGEPGKIYFS